MSDQTLLLQPLAHTVNARLALKRDVRNHPEVDNADVVPGGPGAGYAT